MITRFSKRVIIHFLLLFFLLIFFFGYSHYPNLFQTSSKIPVQSITSPAQYYPIFTNQKFTIASHESLAVTVFKTTSNWLWDIRKEFIFGIIIGGMFMTISYPHKYLSRKGFLGSWYGVLIGAPLSLSVNSIVPIIISMRNKNINIETLLSAMLASPALNLAVLIATFKILPLELALTKITVTLILIFFVIPLIGRQTNQTVEKPDSLIANPPSESWINATYHVINSIIHETGKLVLYTLPLLFMAGMMQSILILTLSPIGLFHGSFYDLYLAIGLVSIFGTLLPIPLLGEILIAKTLLHIGTPIGIVAALLTTLPLYSVFSGMIIGKYISWKTSFILFLAIIIAGIVSGLTLTAFTEYTKPPITFSKTITKVPIIIKGTGFGVSWTDYNNDGYDDVYVNQQFYKNNKNGQLINVTAQAGLSGIDTVTGAAFADYNNDGCSDLYIARHGRMMDPGEPDKLFQNNCNGTFTDVTKKSGVQDNYHGWGVAWADYNNDGFVDLYVANWGVDINEGNAKDFGETQKNLQYITEPNILYKNNGDGTFTNVTDKAGVLGKATCESSDFNPSNPVLKEFKHGYQPIWFDYNSDDKIDLMVATDTTFSPLYHNNGNGTFTEVTDRAGLCEKGLSSNMGITIGDYDNDLDMDMYITNTGDNFLWENSGNSTFSEVGEKTSTNEKGQGWGTNFFDYDNNTFLDLLVINGSFDKSTEFKQSAPHGFKVNDLDEFYENNQDGTFTPIGPRLQFSDHVIKRGSAIADYNNDGFPDMFVVGVVPEKKVYNYIYTSKTNSNNWLHIKLVGTKSNKDAIGAKIKIKAGNKTQIREITAGNSFLSQDSLTQFFGLGKTTTVDLIEVIWPSGKKQLVKQVKANQKITITEN